MRNLRIMKKMFVTTVLTAVAMSAAAVSVNKPDTIISVDNPEKIVFTESSDGISLRMKLASDSVVEYEYVRDDSDVSISAVRRKRTGSNGLSLLYKTGPVDWDLIFGGVSAGLVHAAGAPSGMHVEAAKSYEISAIFILGLRAYWNRHNWLTIGMGYNLRDYELNSTGRFVKADGAISVEPYPEGAHAGRSRLRAEAISMPLIYGHDLGRYFCLHAGPILNVTTGSSLKTTYEVGRNEEGYRAGGIYARKITADLYGAVTYRGWGLYVRYSPMKLIKSGCGPQFSTVSTGIVWAM
ncbi:hypothetical protein D7V95_08135 [bacterium J10(2018)]|nr:hypothetical protein D7V95_08135 [bacterium J10(2018)]